MTLVRFTGISLNNKMIVCEQCSLCCPIILTLRNLKKKYKHSTINHRMRIRLLAGYFIFWKAFINNSE